MQIPNMVVKTIMPLDVLRRNSKTEIPLENAIKMSSFMGYIAS